LFVDGRYTEQAKSSVKKGVKLHKYSATEIKKYCAKHAIKRMAVDGSKMTLDEQIKIKDLGLKTLNCDYS
jgi:hypothetical protein